MVTDLDRSARQSDLLQVHQRLPTSGARRVTTFELDSRLYLAVPQLAADVPGQPPHMNGGNSDVETIVYQWSNGQFIEAQRLAVPGGEDVAYFRIGEAEFLATASIRTGHGPYDLNVKSGIYRRHTNTWTLDQQIPTFAAKQCYPFGFEGRHFLALAQGVTLPNVEARHPRTSRILEWNGSRFSDFQSLEGQWGYGWEFFELSGQRYLAYADHTSASLLYRWNGERFVAFQTFAEQGGRAFEFFATEGSAWLAFANLTGESTLYRWNGQQFTPHQTLGGPGGREFEVFEKDGKLYLVRVCFIQGTPAAPKTDLLSQIYCWEAGHFVKLQDFETWGGTDARAFQADGHVYLAVSNSLSPELRFRQDTIIYRLTR